MQRYKIIKYDIKLGGYNDINKTILEVAYCLRG